MSLRTRLILAFALVVLIPLTLLALGLRREMTSRLSEEYEARVESAVAMIREDLELERAGVHARLVSLRRAIDEDDDARFRAAAIGGGDGEQDLLDYAGSVMRPAGLSMLQIQDAEGRILSSGHFRNEHGRLEPGLPDVLRGASGVVLTVARSPRGDFLALASSEPFTIVGRTFALVGGVRVDEGFLRRLERDLGIDVELVLPDGESGVIAVPPGSRDDHAAGSTTGVWVREVRLPIVRSQGDTVATVDARLLVTQSRAPLDALLRSTDRWFLAVAGVTGLTALLLAVWVSARISRPIAALADKTAVLDLDRLDVEFDEGTDEVGRLSRLLGDLAARLRASTGRIREAERRATIGDVARQVNHDIKNGLIPLRNVVRHLVEVGQTDPGALPTVLAERRQTLDSSIGYLETLAGNYERLARPAMRRDCDLNALVEDAAHGLQGHEHVEVEARLAGSLPRLSADPVAVRRILENLISNAVDSLQSKPGRVVLSTERVDRDDEPPLIRLTVADTGCGIPPDDAARIFTDFYTTKPTGTGLGLSIVRRLVMDLHGTIRAESRPGAGTKMIVEMPARTARV